MLENYLNDRVEQHNVNNVVNINREQEEVLGEYNI